jgi:hypothetical protein
VTAGPASLAPPYLLRKPHFFEENDGDQFVIPWVSP